MCREQLKTFEKQNVRLIICDGPRLLQQETLDIAARLGYNIRIFEVKTPPEVALLRKQRGENHAAVSWSGSSMHVLEVVLAWPLMVDSTNQVRLTHS